MEAAEGGFDYVVAGAGSAGCVIAARLTESGRYRVLLLEAGSGDRSPWIHIPMGFSRLFADRRINWMFESEPEQQLNQRRLFQPRGKVLGGTSSINGMMYVRGHARDYDGWRQRGCTGWDYSSVLPYFKKAEHQTRGEDEFHGIGGPLCVSDPPERSNFARRMVAAAIEAGLPPTADFNGAHQEGAGYYQSTTRNGRRASVSTAYLRPIRKSMNLVVRANAHVTRILVDGKRATGVVFQSDGQQHTARARGEVIVCGGVYGSPQLLQLSGIGPGALVRKIGITPVHELPAVGQHLQDHSFLRMAFKCEKLESMNRLARSLPRRALMLARYLLFRSGPLATNNMLAGAFARSDDRLNRPDLQFNFLPWSYSSRDFKDAKADPFPGFSVSVVHLCPDARGSVEINSPDPMAAPSIRFNFLSTPYDIQALVTGVRWVRRFTQQPTLAPYVKQELVPGALLTSDADLEASLRETAMSNLHSVGTCRMGPPGESVVDPRLRVHGMDRLRVADAAIMPSVPAGNTNAPVIMIGEKAAAMILEDAKFAT